MQINGPRRSTGRGVVIKALFAGSWSIGQAAYSASKAGISGMTLPCTRSIPQGVRIAIAPGIPFS